MSDRASKIKQTLAATKARRKNLQAKTFEIKVDASHLSETKKDKLHQTFTEAKWLYNYILGSEDIWTMNTNLKIVPVFVYNLETSKCDLIEERDIHLGAHIKQEILKGVKSSILGLAELKKRGHKVGRLKFKKRINSLSLKEVGGTFKIGHNYIRVQNIGRLKVRGLHQIKGEVACAKLIRRPSGYYFKITCYIEKENAGQDAEISLDMGVKDTISLTTRQKHKWEFDIPTSIRRAQRKLSRMAKGGKNYGKQRLKIQRLHEKLSNQKDDAANKFVASLKGSSRVAFQDENLSGWQKGWFGKQVNVSVLGRIKARLKKLPTSVMIDRFLPTTKFCLGCHSLNEISLSERRYTCSCGYSEDRDYHSADVVEFFAKILNPPGEPRHQPAEGETAWQHIVRLLPKSFLLKQEAPVL